MENNVTRYFIVPETEVGVTVSKRYGDCKLTFSNTVLHKKSSDFEISLSNVEDVDSIIKQLNDIKYILLKDLMMSKDGGDKR